MSDQDDIDALLKQAGLGGGAKPAAAPASGGAGAISQNDIDSLLSQAGVSGGGSIGGKGGGLAPAGGGFGGEPFRLERFEEGDLDEQGKLDQLMDVSLDVQCVLGKTTMAIEDIIRLKSGSVVELDKLAGDPLDVLVNNRIVARGEVLVLNDNFCIRITEILSPEARVDFGEAV